MVVVISWNDFYNNSKSEKQFLDGTGCKAYAPAVKMILFVYVTKMKLKKLLSINLDDFYDFALSNAKILLIEQ